MAANRLYIISPERIEKVIQSNPNASTLWKYRYSEANPMAPALEINTSFIFNNEYCFYHPQEYTNRCIAFLTKIPRGQYKRLYLDIEIFQYPDSSQYNMYSIFLNSTGIVTGTYAGNFEGTNFKRLVLTDSNWTVEQINAQEGIVIDSTDNHNLSRQTVIIDISDIPEDCWVCTHQCQTGYRIYSMYVDVL